MRSDISTLFGARTSTPETDPFVGAGGRVLVGFDGSTASAAALSWAVSRATRTGAPVCVVGVVDDDSGSMGSAYAASRATELAHLLSETAYRIGQDHPEVEASTRLLEGEVSSALIDAAAPGDLIVVGSDATGFARGRVYGSRSVQLAVAATCNVAVIPSVDLRLRRGVVVGVDSLQDAARLARLGAQEASNTRSELTLVHALPLGSGEERVAFADASLNVARAAAAQQCDHLETTSHLAHRRPADAMLNLSRDKALLVIGRSRESHGLGVGGALHEVVINANVPILVAPSRAQDAT